MMRANVERTYDEYERMAVMAIMNRHGYHAKKLKQGDLFTRPTDDDFAKSRTEEIEDRKARASEWMSRIKQFQNADIGEYSKRGGR